MPAIALVGAAASVTAGIAAGGILGGMMIAGGVLTGLGTLTGNKKLMKIGAVLGAVGGIGSMISNATSAASAGASIGGEGVSMGTAAGNAGSNAIEMGMGVMDDVAAGSSAAFSSPVASSGIVGNQIAPPGSVESFYGAVPAETGASSVAPAMSAETAATQQAIAQQAATGGITNATVGGKSMGAATNPLGESLNTLKGWGKDAFGFVTDPKNANLVKVGGGLVQGAMGSYNQQSQLEQQMAAREAERARFNRSIIGQYVTR